MTRITLVLFALAATRDGHGCRAGSTRGWSDGGDARFAQVEQPIVPLGTVFECYRRAHDDTLLDEASVTELCEGTTDASPVFCYLDARKRTYLSPRDAISLCRCATSTAPVDCYLEGYQTTRLDPSRILPLCSPRERLHLASDCSPNG